MSESESRRLETISGSAAQHVLAFPAAAGASAGPDFKFRRCCPSPPMCSREKLKTAAAKPCQQLAPRRACGVRPCPGTRVC